MIVNEASSDSLDFKQLGFEIEKTKDDSPTLRLINSDDERGGESMHHSGGALSETCLIYGQALDWGFQQHKNPLIISLGLGLGYVEILACAKSLLHNSSIELLSFEIVDGLRENFRKFFIEGKKSEVYEWILQNIASTEKVDAEELRSRVKKSLLENQIQLLGNFIPWAPNLKTFDVFCYDAFSKKTSPELWDEEFMKDVFLKGSAKSCVGTYASNGVLKRSLAAGGFNLERLEGFQGKRNRTWATK